MSDTTPEPTADERLAEITTRNRRLRNVPFETHGGGHDHGPSCPACELVRGVDDVKWLLAENQRMREFEASIIEAQVSLQSSAFYVGWLKGFNATATAGVYTQAHLDTVEYAEEIRALNAGSVPQQPENGGDPR